MLGVTTTVTQADLPYLREAGRLGEYAVVFRVSRNQLGGGFGDQDKHPFAWGVLVYVDAKLGRVLAPGDWGANGTASIGSSAGSVIRASGTGGHATISNPWAPTRPAKRTKKRRRPLAPCQRAIYRRRARPVASMVPTDDDARSVNDGEGQHPARRWFSNG